MKKEINIALNNRIKQIREERGITQRELAWVCFQNEAEIRRYEKGKRFPNYPVLRRMARFMEVSIEEMYPQVKEIDEQVDRIKEILMERKSCRVKNKN